MILHDVALAIREVGQIWLIDYTAYGTMFRADVGKSTVRVVVPKPGKSAAEVPEERNSPLHIACTIGELRDFLHTLNK
ncbi:hypothetical protein [Spirosoma areae]